MTKKVLFSILTIGTIISSMGYRAAVVLAEEENPIREIVITAIAQKYNVDKFDVEAVLTAVRDQKIDEMEAQISA